MKIKSFFSLLITLVLIFLCGCNSSIETTSSNQSWSSNETGKAASETIRLLYSSKDTLDPYTCVTEQNAVLSQLIFEPLLIINNQYEIEYRLAKNVDLTDNICKVELIDAKFSDGTTVTAEDVVFSFNKAKKSTTTRHASALQYVVSATATDNKNITFVSSRKDAYLANLLTFPIMKLGSDELKDTDNQNLVPIGAGKYIFDNQTATLTLNQHYYGEKSIIKNINTVDCPDHESVEQAITANMVDFYYTPLSNNIIPKMNGNSISIAQNQIVFLGVNPNNPQLSNSLFRQAISSAINRQEICNTAFYNNAYPALGPVPSAWKPAEGLLTIESTQNTEIANNNIILAGFTQKDKNGFYLLKNNSPITFSLLVNSNNDSRTNAAKMISDSLLKIGIKINVNAVSEEQYFSFLRSGRYDLYLGEIRFEDNMDISGLVSISSASKFTSNNSTSSNTSTTSSSSAVSSNNSVVSNSSSNSAISSESSEEFQQPGIITLTTENAYKGFYNGEYSFQDLITTFNAELPVIPICFKNGLVIYSDRFGNGITPTKTELFHGIHLLK